MKVLLINGSPHKEGCTYTALKEVADTLEANGIKTEMMYLGVKPIAGCIACGNCQKTGKCFVDDRVNEFIAKLPEIDGIVLGSPVYYAGASGQITSFLDRAFFAGSGKFEGKLGAAVVSCRRGGASATFDQLNKYFTMNSMPVVSSQYWKKVGNNLVFAVDLRGNILHELLIKFHRNALLPVQRIRQNLHGRKRRL